MKYLASVFLAAVLLVPAAAFADIPTIITGGNGDPMNVTMPWGMTGYQTPVFATGQSVTDKGGVVLTCPFFEGCFDLTNTQYYNSAMLSTAQQLKAAGYTNSTIASQWSGWLNLAQ